MAQRRQFLQAMAGAAGCAAFAGLGLGLYARQTSALPAKALRPPGAQPEEQFLGACLRCGLCVRSCPYHVPRINEEGVSHIDEALCHGCGICAAECPAKAIELNWYEDEQLLCKVDALLEGVI